MVEHDKLCAVSVEFEHGSTTAFSAAGRDSVEGGTRQCRACSGTATVVPSEAVQHRETVAVGTHAEQRPPVAAAIV